MCLHKWLEFSLGRITLCAIDSEIIMSRRNCLLLFLVAVVQTIYAKDVELPLCPTNIAFFPQGLPMHCRMPNGMTFNSQPIPMKSSPSPNKVPPPMPFPMPPGFPAPVFPPGVGMPPMPPIPGPLPIPIVGPPPQKLPVIVMPFYSPDPPHKKEDKKKKKKKDSSESGSCYDDNTDDESDSGGGDSGGYWRPKKSGKKRRKHKRIHKHSGRRSNRNTYNNEELLTPMIQYVTKDGYVIFEKEISKGEAKDWLSKKEKQVHENGVSFKELDAIQHELGEDVVVEDRDEPTFVRVKSSNSKKKPAKMGLNTPTPTPKVLRKKFKRIEDGAASFNKITKIHNEGKN